MLFLGYVRIVLSRSESNDFGGMKLFVMWLWQLSLVLLAFGLSSASAETGVSSLERVRALHAKGTAVLLGHQRLEDSLLFEDNDRLVVFMSVPSGGKMILDEVVLFLNGQEVVRYPYSGAELLKFQGRGEQVLYATRVPPGKHSIRLEAKMIEGRMKPMTKPYTFEKGRGGKFVEVQIVGSPDREVQVSDW